MSEPKVITIALTKFSRHLIFLLRDLLLRPGGARSVEEPLDYVIPAWTAGIQVYMDVSERILRIWMPAIHAGMARERRFK